MNIGTVIYKSLECLCYSKQSTIMLWLHSVSIKDSKSSWGMSGNLLPSLFKNRIKGSVSGNSGVKPDSQ